MNLQKKYICVSGTYYNILLFCLLTDFLHRTIFFVSSSIEYRDENNFFEYSRSKGKFSKILDIFRNYYKFQNLQRKYFFNREAILFVQDHVISFYTFLCGKKYFLLEDGLANYRDTANFYQKNQKLPFWTRKIKKILGKIPHLGVSEQAERIFLRGILPIPECIQNKVEIMNIEELWNQKTQEEKKWINHFFRIKPKDMLFLQRKKIVLFTQPLSEDGIIKKEEKINIYRKILKDYRSNEVLIKTHPREKTNYKMYFPEIEVLETIAPIELYLLNGIKIEIAITLFSTAVYGLKEKGTKVIFYGTGIHSNIKKRFGNKNFGIDL